MKKEITFALTCLTAILCAIYEDIDPIIKYIPASDFSHVFAEVFVPQFKNPVHYQDFVKLTSPFGLRKKSEGATGGRPSHHGGVDIAGTWRARIVAVQAGTVIEHWPPPDEIYSGHRLYGGYIRILHHDGSISGYAHLSSTYISEGQKVNTNQVIGRMGNTGFSNGEHLHFTLNIEGKQVNPLQYIELSGAKS